MLRGEKLFGKWQEQGEALGWGPAKQRHSWPRRSVINSTWMPWVFAERNWIPGLSL